MDAPEDHSLEASLTAASTNSQISSGQSKFKTAYEETKHFAGGLISHQFESSKHFSVLRHSHGFVLYRGSATNIAFTIFSDEPLPSDRSLWLQSKGSSGKTGLRIGTLGGKKNGWVDVTPSQKIQADQLPVSDERAWQRDIKKFLDKAPKQIRHHQVRETTVVRIPCEVDDGYFRIVLCTNAGKKILCPSPVFRIASFILLE